MPECNIDNLKVLLNIKKHGSQVFEIPYHLKETTMTVCSWGFEVHETIGKQIIIDLRSEIDKANVRLNKYVNTFRKASCNVWQDRPNLINYEQVQETKW